MSNGSSCELFQYSNRFYATLQGHGPDDNYRCDSPKSFRSIPDGWTIATNTWDSRMAIASQRWGVCYLQLSDSSIWYTSSCFCCNYPYQWGSNVLISYDGRYRTRDTCSDILLMSLFCAPGFYLSGSSCYACSNPIPANASYAPVSSPSEYADSKCPWECNAGFYQSSEWMVCFPCTNPIPPFAFYTTPGLLDQPDSCEWACSSSEKHGEACDVSYSYSMQHMVSYEGKVFAAFDDVAPTSLNLSCQRDGSMYQQPPVGWALAPWSEEAVR
eukprot:358949-Hanusia_phi.AAC.1